MHFGDKGLLATCLQGLGFKGLLGFCSLGFSGFRGSGLLWFRLVPRICYSCCHVKPTWSFLLKCNTTWCLHYALSIVAHSRLVRLCCWPSSLVLHDTDTFNCSHCCVSVDGFQVLGSEGRVKGCLYQETHRMKLDTLFFLQDRLLSCTCWMSGWYVNICRPVTHPPKLINIQASTIRLRDILLSTEPDTVARLSLNSYSLEACPRVLV